MSDLQFYVAAMLILATGVALGWWLHDVRSDIEARRRSSRADGVLATVQITFLGGHAVRTDMLLDADELATLANSIGMHLVHLPTTRLQ